VKTPGGALASKRPTGAPPDEKTRLSDVSARGRHHSRHDLCKPAALPDDDGLVTDDTALVPLFSRPPVWREVASCALASVTRIHSALCSARSS
jgi:hypothetical protein